MVSPGSWTNHPGGFETFMYAEHQTLLSFPDSPTWEIHAIWMLSYNLCFHSSHLQMICLNKVFHGRKFHSMHLSGNADIFTE